MLPTAVLSLSLMNLLALGVGSSTSKAPPASGNPQQHQQAVFSLGHPSWSLGLQLYKALRSEGSHTNTLISPVLLASSLGALSRTAKGTTAAQLQELLQTAKDKKKAEEALSNVLKSMHEGNGTSYALHASSALFSKQVPALEKAFLKELQAQFGLGHVALSAGDKQRDMEKLRSWAKDGMGGLEGPPLTEEPDPKEGAMILANALHLKGFWDRSFDQENQDLRSFLGTKYTKVYMMHRSGVYRHYEDMENMVQVLELGLWGGKASMVLLLPFHVESLARLERVLTLEQLEKWLGKLSSISMALSLPRVNVSSTLSLQKQLAALGVVDAWDQKVADFSGLSGQAKGNLHLEDVLHWASLELTSESGSKDSMDKDEHVEKPKLFYADHSFIILVKDNSTGALLLLGALDLAEGVTLHDEL
ncbi:serine (or cysteine) peptidase inhibitor, clade H, member 2 [Pygocentrus nattereri]|nr:serine (or cysteine) peptidase inhibitor, clade H, member 2 [Pygocentrus nattereri]XP_017539419.1 serine (or cysteine) peptidase inhibitor, clade H, member 2 [Pygocentrus nattereri]XP_037391071.1 serine (or cysteine) peptidase inhibitor, clade H, member 2 [Pygocentrus nattereri]